MWKIRTSKPGYSLDNFASQGQHSKNSMMNLYHRQQNKDDQSALYTEKKRKSYYHYGYFKRGSGFSVIPQRF